ncbi:glycosyltransferase family 39 protein [Bacillus sp. XF8]|uniref:glycosyltransferase family 39 protein n=1 Tax=Bacillus sp. XF8 TaxID=2819289 RepID=UPI001AA09D43|nr:glycosyltransferase family 39 protein [Bacillus sp. XF8]MBO1581557.1 glycosyltransferase family 39 protein [Bacillus sp. XF8]
MPKLYKFTSRSLQILAFLFFILTFIYSLQSLLNNPTYNHIPFLLFMLIIGVILILFVALIVNRYMNKRKFILFICLLAFGLRLSWVLTIDTNVIQDFERMYQGAISAANHDFTFATKPYFTTWVYQLGFTMYQAAVVKLFGTGTLAIKLLNILYCTGITLFIYRIAAQLFNEFSGRIAALTFAMYIPNIIMCSVLTNQHLATFLFYAGFYLLIKKGITHPYAWIFASVLIAFGDIMRPIGLVILLALACFLFLVHIIGEQKISKKMVLKKLVGIIGIYYIVHYIVSYSFIAAGITQYPLSNRDPYWKFVLGFNHETAGAFSFTDYQLVNQYDVGEERFAIEKNLIQERTKDKKQFVVLLHDKFKSMWGDYDASVYWALEGYEYPNLKNLLWTTEKLSYISICLFACLSFMRVIKETNNKQLSFFLLLLLGYAAVHLLIEIQTRYRYFIMPTFIIIQSYGIYLTTQYIKKKFRHKTKSFS